MFIQGQKFGCMRDEGRAISLVHCIRHFERVQNQSSERPVRSESLNI